MTAPPGEPVLGRTRCVVWTPRGERIPSRLAHSLEHHGLAVTVVDDAFAAVAHVCRVHREGPGHGGVVMVPCFPERLTGVALALEVVSRHAPRAICWWYDTAGGECIRAVTSADIARWAGNGATPAGAAAEPKIVVRPQVSGPRLRLAGDGPDQPPARRQPEPAENLDNEDGASSATPASMLTADELAMLLGEDMNGRPQPGVQPGGGR